MQSSIIYTTDVNSIHYAACDKYEDKVCDLITKNLLYSKTIFKWHRSYTIDKKQAYSQQGTASRHGKEYRSIFPNIFRHSLFSDNRNLTSS